MISIPPVPFSVVLYMLFYFIFIFFLSQETPSLFRVGQDNSEGACSGNKSSSPQRLYHFQRVLFVRFHLFSTRLTSPTNNVLYIPPHPSILPFSLSLTSIYSSKRFSRGKNFLQSVH